MLSLSGRLPAFAGRLQGLTVTLASADLCVGFGAADLNLELLAHVGQQARSWGHPFVLGAEFNMTKEELSSIGLLAHAKLRVLELSDGVRT